MSSVSREQKAAFIVDESNLDFHGINKGQLGFLLHNSEAGAGEWMGFCCIL